MRVVTPVITLIALVLPLGLDTFAVAAALGVSDLNRTRQLRVSLTMASSEAGMPLVGLALGAPLGETIGAAADYIAIGVSSPTGLGEGAERLAGLALSGLATGLLIEKIAFG